MEEKPSDSFLEKDTVTTLRRLAIGALLASAIPLGAYSLALGIAAFAATSLASIAINSTVQRLQKKANHEKLLHFYKDEIATLLHKSPDSVTVADLRQVAAPLEEGGKGVSILHNELTGLDRYYKFRLGGSAISSVLTTGTLIAISLIYPDFIKGGAFNLALGLGLTSLGYTLIAKAVKTISQSIFGDHEIDNTVSQRLMRMAETIKQKPVAPIEVFGVLADADLALKEEIKRRFGMVFADLPALQKEQVVVAYEPRYRMIALTEAMNKGGIKPSLAGFIMCGQANEKLPGYEKYRALFNPPGAGKDATPAEKDGMLSVHQARLLAEREEPAAAHVLH